MYLIIIVGITIGVTFTVVGDITDSFDTMTSSNRLAIETVNAYTDNNRMVISGNIKNLGSQPISSVVIDEIRAGDLIIIQNPATSDGQIVDGHGDMTIEGVTDTGDTLDVTTVDYGDAVVVATTTGTLTWSASSAGTDNTFRFNDQTTAATGVATVRMTGFSTDESSLTGISAGVSQAFRIVITGISAGGHADVLDILRTVPASTELFITLTGTDGQTTTISEPRTTRVTQR